MKYYLVEHDKEYMMKTEENTMYSSWYSTVKQVLNNLVNSRGSSASALSDNRILCTFDELPTYEHLLQYYPELLI
jgi:hypothetical protein